MRNFTMKDSLEDDDILLATLTHEHLRSIEDWHKDPITQRFTITTGKENYSDLLEWFMADYARNTRETIYIIHVDGDPIGYLTIILESQDKCEVGIVIAKQNRKHGAGYRSMGLLCFSLFDLGIRKIKVRILTENKPALKLANKLGFKKEGKLRKEIWHLGKYVNAELLSMFISELTYKPKSKS